MTKKQRTEMIHFSTEVRNEIYSLMKRMEERYGPRQVGSGNKYLPNPVTVMFSELLNKETDILDKYVDLSKPHD